MFLCSALQNSTLTPKSGSPWMQELTDIAAMITPVCNQQAVHLFCVDRNCFFLRQIVFSIAVTAHHVYVGGSFKSVGAQQSQTSENIARFNIGKNVFFSSFENVFMDSVVFTDTDWWEPVDGIRSDPNNPSATYVQSLYLNDSILYVGGTSTVCLSKKKY